MVPVGEGHGLAKPLRSGICILRPADDGNRGGGIDCIAGECTAAPGLMI